MIKLTNVFKKQETTLALNTTNLELPSTGLIIIKGRSGLGKPTFMNLIGGLDKPSTGEIESFGHRLDTYTPEQIRDYREKLVSYVFQKDYLFEKMTIKENISLFGIDENFDTIIDTLKLRTILDKPLKEATQSEKTRTAIARAAVQNSKIILADDPLSSIEPELKKDVYELFKMLAKTHLVIITSNDEEFIKNYGNMILNISNDALVDAEARPLDIVSNEIKPHTNIFDKLTFFKKALFANKSKLIITSVLLVISIITLLLATSMSTIDYVDLQTKAMINEKDTAVIFKKSYYNEDTKRTETAFTETELQNLQEKVGSLALGKKLNVQNKEIKFELNYTSTSLPYFYDFKISEMFFFTSEHCGELLQGALPQNDSEVVITSYLAEQIVLAGVKDAEGKLYKPSSLDELIADKHTLDFAGQTVTISGIEKLALEQFESLEEKENPSLYRRMEEYIGNVAGNIYVTDEFFQRFENYRPALKRYTQVIFPPNHDIDLSLDDKETSSQNEDLKFKIFEEPVVLKRVEEPVYHLQEDEIIINGSILTKIKKNPETAVGATVELHFEDTYSHNISPAKTFRIVGISDDNQNYMSKEAMKDYLVVPFTTEKVVLSANEEQITQILKTSTENEPLKIITDFSNTFDKIKKYGPLVSKILAGVGAVLFIASISMMMSYTKDSLQNHKKNIAIMQAFGMSNKKLVPLFMLELLFVAFSSYVISLVLFFITRPLIGLIVKSITTIKIELFPIVIIYIFIILFVTLIVALATSLIAYKKVSQPRIEVLFQK